MKQKIKIIDNVSHKTIESEKEIRNIDHFNIQLRTRAHVFDDRRKRAPKHKKKVLEDE